MELQADYRDILAAFDAAEVEYLLVGGVALAFYARPRFTKHLDLWIGPSLPNLARARRALVAFGAPEAMLAHLESATSEDVLWMGAPPVRVDVMKGVPGGDFDACYRRREVIDLAGVKVQLVSRADLIALKRGSGRPQDLLDVEELEALSR